MKLNTKNVKSIIITVAISDLVTVWKTKTPISYTGLKNESHILKLSISFKQKGFTREISVFQNLRFI